MIAFMVVFLLVDTLVNINNFKQNQTLIDTFCVSQRNVYKTSYLPYATRVVIATIARMNTSHKIYKKNKSISKFKNTFSHDSDFYG